MLLVGGDVVEEEVAVVGGGVEVVVVGGGDVIVGDGEGHAGGIVEGAGSDGRHVGSRSSAADAATVLT